MARTLFLQGDREEWPLKADEAADFFREQGDLAMEAQELQYIAQLYLEQGDPPARGRAERCTAVPVPPSPDLLARGRNLPPRQLSMATLRDPPARTRCAP